ncbi:amidase family protein [Nocardia carnea]|uniref:amidase family protein n=1 Tax=Nocardia carnea TaxID=37328 RepID=UPI002457AC7A|nr:amidase family protein [Nocardia carnea]
MGPEGGAAERGKACAGSVAENTGAAGRAGTGSAAGAGMGQVCGTRTTPVARVGACAAVDGDLAAATDRAAGAAGGRADRAAPEGESDNARDADPAVWRLRGAPLIAATATGPLAGATVAVKDLYALSGFTIGAGVQGFLREQRPAVHHAAVVARLLAAGAEVAGIAHTDEFAYSLTGSNGRYGMPVNPAAPDRIPGGSTSGPAVAVARGEADIGLGTDTAGSIRVPAAYQGLWGIRTTHGRIDTTGLLPLAQSFDTVGWVTADGATLAAVAECLLGPDTATPAGVVVDDRLCAAADPGIGSAVRQLAGTWDAEPVGIYPPDGWLSAFRVVQAYEAWANHGEWVAAHPGELEPDVAQRFAFAATVTAGQAAAARAELAAAADRIRTTLGDRVLLLPAAATPPPPRTAGPELRESTRARTLRLTCLASIAGLPAVTLPLGRDEGGPSGVCLVGAPGTDRSLISLALSTAAVPAEGSPHSEEPV